MSLLTQCSCLNHNTHAHSALYVRAGVTVGVQPAEASRENATSSEALRARLIIGSWGIEFPNASNEEEEGQKDDHREDGFYDPIDLIEQDERSEDSNKEHSAWGRETSESGHCASVAGLRSNQSHQRSNRRHRRLAP